MKNFYKILGVLDDAEDIVIRAAYKALAQRYHPDKWKGDPTTANQRMADINEAYSVLSDESKRKQYDKEFFNFNSRNDAENNSDDDLEDIPNEEIEGWELAIEFFPIIKTQYEELKKISGILANTFRTKLIETKDYKNSYSIRDKYEKDYLIKFYGKDESIRSYAKHLLVNGHPKAAIRLNKIIRLMGVSINLAAIKKKIIHEFPETSEEKTVHDDPVKFSIYLIKNEAHRTTDLMRVIEHFHNTKIKVHNGFWNAFYTFEADGIEYKQVALSVLYTVAKKTIEVHC
jgi:curved DNA-binding protein CbpA